jgi:Hypoxanthine-guanine phosphoribosyltransferase
VIAILNGSLMFMADLLRRIPLPLRLDCLSVASYHGGITNQRRSIFRQVAQPDVAGRDILLLDDILDSGTTINAIREKLQTASPKVFAFAFCCGKSKSGRVQLKQIMSASILPMNLLLATAWIMAKAIAISPASAF